MSRAGEPPTPLLPLRPDIRAADPSWVRLRSVTSSSQGCTTGGCGAVAPEGKIWPNGQGGYCIAHREVVREEQGCRVQECQEGGGSEQREAAPAGYQGGTQV